MKGIMSLLKILHQLMFTSDLIKKYLKKGAKSKKKHYRKDVKTISLENSNWIMKNFEISLYNHTLIYDLNRCTLV